ncbi:Polyisoprenoid-binding protein YceI [Cognatiyoonia koreensis]|uniref:Polyisoprenoid-binding protein YceI n=1 Tax=Cognatiyoonia koreensis TaxID=364200 RepID=A0A1I0PN67_9RHOB|nr:YceI family protein [Cognatiyoonia koreensis]SEW15278.1 Polyisoprenoid-binding protein YceI [Cognatiyoonia koreensis]
MIKTVLTRTATTIAFLAAAATAQADGWTLDAENSKISFGSIKNHDVGESHSFGDLSGSVSADGMAMIEIALASVQTNVDVRNERLIEHVFTDGPKASLTASIDMAAMAAIPVGGMTRMLVEGDLTLIGEPVPVDVTMFAVRLAEDKVMVVSDDLIFVSAAEAGINQGVDKLQELAGLDHIARAVPASLRLVFEAN